MRKSVVVLILLITSVTALVSFTKADPPKYENLKVLPKNTNKQQLDSIMRHFSMSLGVRCTFCHVRKDDEKKDFDFASDANEKKLIARSMMRMAIKINKKYFKEEKEKTDQMQVANAITCYSCHHGQEHPAKFAPPQPRPDQPKPDQPKPGK